jgi:hypothetical protein
MTSGESTSSDKMREPSVSCHVDRLMRGMVPTLKLSTLSIVPPNGVHEPPPERAARRVPTSTAGGRSARCTC